MNPFSLRRINVGVNKKETTKWKMLIYSMKVRTTINNGEYSGTEMN